MKLLSLYESVLSCANLKSDDGFLYGMNGDEKMPVTIKGKRLVLPTDTHLRSPDGKVFFHPLNENLVGNIDPALEKFRALAIAKINLTIGLIGFSILEMLASPAEQKTKLNPVQTEALVCMKDADEETLKRYKKLLEEMPINEANKGFMHAFLRRGFTYGGKKYARGSIVSFPLAADLAEDGKVVYGVKLRGKDLATLNGFYDLLFPNHAEKHAYSVMSDSDIAPYAMAMFGTVEKIGKRLNEVIDMFASILGDGVEKFDLSWCEHYYDMGKLLPEIRRIPNLANTNEDNHPTGPVVTEVAPASVGPTIIRDTGPANQTVSQTSVATQTPIPSRGPVPLRDTMPEQNKVQTIPVVHQQPQPIYQIPQPYQQPMVQQQNHLMPGLVQQQAPVARTEKGAVFDSFLMTQPGLAAKVASAFPAQQQMQPMQETWNPARHFPPAQQQMQPPSFGNSIYQGNNFSHGGV